MKQLVTGQICSFEPGFRITALIHVANVHLEVLLILIDDRFFVQGYKFFGFDPETLCYIGTKEEKERLEEERSSTATTPPTAASATAATTTTTTVNINNGVASVTTTEVVTPTGVPQAQPPTMQAYLASST